MFHFISSYDLVETEVYHQKFSFTRKWEDCGGLSDCEELVGTIAGDDGVGFRGIQNISSIGGFESKSRN